MLHGCKLGAQLDLRQIIFESDAAEVISCLSSSGVDNWEVSPSLERIRVLGDSFQSCRWSWVPRSANKAAHSLALHNSSEMSDSIWVDRPPSSLVFVLNNDGLPCLH